MARAHRHRRVHRGWAQAIAPGWSPQRSRIGRDSVTEWAIGIATVLLLLVGAEMLVPARADMLAYGRVFAPYLALLFVPLGLVAVIGRTGRWRLLGLLALVGICAGVVRFLPATGDRTRAADPSALQVRMSTWNIERGSVPAATLVGWLAARAPAVIGLQELTPDAAAVIAADPDLRERYPYQVLRPTPSWDGMGLLSSWPLDVEPAADGLPPLIAASVTVGPGTSIDVITAHAPPPIYPIGAFGPGYDPSRRDASLRLLRDRIDRSLEADHRVVLLGDLNLTDREVAHGELVDGLTDAHLAVGGGLGHTWRPRPLAMLPFGLLRIDMVLTGPGVVPLSSEPDCTPGAADHCLLDVVLELPPAESVQ